MSGRILGALAVAAAAGAFYANPAPAEIGSLVPAEVVSARISTAGPRAPSAHGHTFTFQVMIDACPALLELDHVTLVERPKSPGSRKGVAVITAFLREPQHVETGAPCPPLPPLFKSIRVRTGRPASKLIFFDGSSSPPRRVYPR